MTWKRYFNVALGCSLIATIALHLQLLFPKFPGGQKSVLRQFHGWKELAEKLDTALDEIIPSCPDIFVYAKRYQVASELNFYCRHEIPVYEIQEGKDAHQFGLWSRPTPVRQSCVIALLKDDESEENLPAWLREGRKFSSENWEVRREGKVAQHVRAFMSLPQ